MDFGLTKHQPRTVQTPYCPNQVLSNCPPVRNSESDLMGEQLAYSDGTALEALPGKLACGFRALVHRHSKIKGGGRLRPLGMCTWIQHKTQTLDRGNLIIIHTIAVVDAILARTTRSSARRCFVAMLEQQTLATFFLYIHTPSESTTGRGPPVGAESTKGAANCTPGKSNTETCTNLQNAAVRMRFEAMHGCCNGQSCRKQAVLCPPVATNRPILDDPCLYNVHAQRGCCLIGHARPANLTAMSPTMAASANPHWRRRSMHAMLLDHNWQHRCVHGPILRSHHGFA